MEPKLVLGKRKHNLLHDDRKCIICQSNTSERLRSTEIGRQRLNDVASKILKVRHDKFNDAVDRLLQLWHLRLADKKLDNNDDTSASASNGQMSMPIRRSCMAVIDWKECIFCQRNTRRGKLSRVINPETSASIIEAAHKDDNMRCRSVSDLVARKEKYHLYCYTNFFSLPVGRDGTDRKCTWTSVRCIDYRAPNRYCEWSHTFYEWCMWPLYRTASRRWHWRC